MIEALNNILTPIAIICLVAFLVIHVGHCVCILVRSHLEKKRCE